MAQLNKVQISSRDWNKVTTDVLAVAVFKGGALSAMGKAVDKGTGKIISKAVKGGDFKGKSNETLMLFSGGSPSRLLLVGLGERKELTLEGVREAGGAVAKAVQSAGHETVSAEVPALKKLGEAETTQAFVEVSRPGPGRPSQQCCDTRPTRQRGQTYRPCRKNELQSIEPGSVYEDGNGGICFRCKRCGRTTKVHPDGVQRREERGQAFRLCGEGNHI